jgi:hypothetical protein
VKKSLYLLEVVKSRLVAVLPVSEARALQAAIRLEEAIKIHNKKATSSEVA